MKTPALAAAFLAVEGLLIFQFLRSPQQTAELSATFAAATSALLLALILATTSRERRSRVWTRVGLIAASALVLAFLVVRDQWDWSFGVVLALHLVFSTLAVQATLGDPWVGGCTFPNPSHSAFRPATGHSLSAFKINADTNVPVVLEVLTDRFSVMGAVGEEGIFRVPAKREDLERLEKEMFQPGAEGSFAAELNEQGDPHLAAGLIKRFLRGTEPKVLQVEPSEDEEPDEETQKIRQATLQHVLSLFRDVVGSRETNQMTAKNVAIAVGPSMFPDPLVPQMDVTLVSKKLEYQRTYLEKLLQNQPPLPKRVQLRTVQAVASWLLQNTTQENSSGEGGPFGRYIYDRGQDQNGELKQEYAASFNTLLDQARSPGGVTEVPADTSLEVAAELLRTLLLDLPRPLMARSNFQEWRGVEDTGLANEPKITLFQTIVQWLEKLKTFNSRHAEDWTLEMDGDFTHEIGEDDRGSPSLWNDVVDMNGLP